MLLSIIVFFLVSGAVVGVYYALVHRPEHQAERQFEQRLKDLSSFETESGDAPSIVLAQKPTSSIPGMERLVATNAGSWLAALIEQSGVAITPGSVITMSLGFAAVLGLVTLLFTHMFLAALAAGIRLPASMFEGVVEVR